MIEQQRKFFALMMGIESTYLNSCKCDKDDIAWSPSPDGKRISYAVMDFMEEKLPEWWNDYLGITSANSPQSAHDDIDMLNAQLSLSNLYDYILSRTENCPTGGDGLSQ